jgi:hypothetical protein
MKITSKVAKICHDYNMSQKDVNKVTGLVEYVTQLGHRVTSQEISALCQKHMETKNNRAAVKQEISLEDVTGGLRTSDSYTRGNKEIIKLVTIQENIMPVGSYKFNVHKYASDIDIMERINVCCSVEQAKEKVAKGIQRIARLIRSAPNVYLGDFKAGKDDRFSIDLGSWIPVGDLKTVTAALVKESETQESSGVLSKIGSFLGLTTAEETTENPVNTSSRPNVENGLVLVGYNPTEIENRINRLVEGRLISFAEFRRLQGLIKKAGNSPTMEQWEELQALIRDHQVLRWSLQEISQGYKMLQGFRKLTLEDALAEKTLVKLDAWAKVNGRWIEVTNFFLINAVDSSGRVIEQLTQEMPDYIKSMSKDVKHYSSAEHRKTLKALKRLWALSIFKKDYALAKQMTQIFSSKGAALNQIVGESEVLRSMLTKLDDPPVEDIMEQIDSFKSRIDQLNEVSEMNSQLFQLINSIVEPFYAHPVSEYIAFDQAIENLGQLEGLINQAVEKMISQQASELGMENPAEYV